MKSKIVGILFIITGALMLFGFILSMLMFFGDGVDSALINGLLSIVFAIFALNLGSSLRARKKWSWHVGLVTLSLALVGNIVTLVINFTPLLFVPIVLEILSIYAIYADKSQFHFEEVPEQVNNIPTNITQDIKITQPNQTISKNQDLQQP